MAGSRGRWVVAAAVAVVAAAGAGAFLLLSENDEASGPIVAGSVFEEGACRQQLAADFGFSRLPPVREPSFDLGSSGPRATVSLRGLEGRLVPPGGDYRVWVEGDWQVRARMLALDDQGAVLEEVSRDKLGQTAEQLRFAQLRMRVGEEPGFYLVELLVAGAGRRSGRYGFYLKAEPPHAEARLGISGRRFHPGEKAKIRVENLGTETIAYGLPFHLDQEVGGEWKRVPDERVWALPLLNTPGGEAGECQTHELAPDLPPGRYRFLKEVSTSTKSGASQDHTITAEFNVVG